MDDDNASWKYSGEIADNADTDNSDEIQRITWQASEYIAHEKSFGWYFTFYALSLVVAIVIYLVTKSTLTGAVIVVMSLCAGFLASRPPQAKNYEISQEGVNVGGRLFSFDQFISFSVVAEGAIDSIWLKQIGRFKPLIVMYFAPEDEEKIIEVLSNFLPHEQRELDPIDQLMRRLRF